MSLGSLVTVQTDSMLILKSKTTGAFSLLEVILAISIFILLATALVGGYLYGQEATMLAGNRAQATFLAEEALEAVRNMRDEDFSNLTNGTHGLVISGNQWTLSGSSDTNGIFTRQVEISSIDGDRKEVTSVVTWQQNVQRSGLVSLNTYLTNWAGNAQTACADEQSLLNVDTSGAVLTNSNRRLAGINVGSAAFDCDIIITHISISYTSPAGRRLQEIFIDGNSVWTGNVASGTTNDIADFAIAPGQSGIEIIYRFNNSVVGRIFSIVFTMSDGTTKTVSGISP